MQGVGATAEALTSRLPDAALPHVERAYRRLHPSFWRQVRRWREFIRESDRWSLDRVETYQLDRLRSLLGHAYEHVPYYGRIFTELDARPEDFTSSFEAFAAFPTLSKADLQTHGQELLATNVQASDRVYFTTAGSTGIPVGFHVDVAQLPRGRAFLLEQWARVGYRVGDSSAVLRGNVVPGGKLFRRAPWEHQLVMSSYHLTEDRLPHYFDRLDRFRPRFLQAYPSSATILARFMLEHERRGPPGLQAVLCGSENVYDWQRQLIEEAFGVRVFSWYGQTETVGFAAECEQDTRLHIVPQYGLIELVDLQGRAIAEPGRPGEIVATGLDARAMPLIRYRTMDVATFASGTCEACGRPYRLIERIEGRLQEFIITATGREIAMTAINMHSPVFDNVSQFRFYQETPGKIILRVVPLPRFRRDQDEPQIRHELAPKLGDDVHLTLEIVDEIPRSGRGKYRFLEQKLPTAFSQGQ